MKVGRGMTMDGLDMLQRVELVVRVGLKKKAVLYSGNWKGLKVFT